MALTIDELKVLIQNDEHRQLELKGESRDFDPLKMAESITDLRTHGYKDSRK